MKNKKKQVSNDTVYSKINILTAKKYNKHKYILDAELKSNRNYTTEEIEGILKKWGV